MNQSNDHHDWPDRIERLIEGLDAFERVVVLSETESTQDAARRESADPGSVVVAARQTSGRGRQGRAWADDLGRGLSVTLVVHPEDSAYLCSRAAVAVARAVVPLLEERRLHAGIKWPNDLVVLSGGVRKLAGILVERDDRSALVGIGINVLSRAWPPGLGAAATSLEELGVDTTRLAVLERLLVEWDRATRLRRRELLSDYARFDVLTGSSAVVEVDGTTIRGTVRGIDPFTGITLETAQGPRIADPERAHVADWRPPGGFEVGARPGR